MNEIKLSKNYNYIAAFLTLRCNLGCSYCINRQGELKPRKELSGKEWVKLLGRINTREDLPITLQGGEPTMHKDFYYIVNHLHAAGKKLDLLTNGMWDVYDFIKNVPPEVFRRYAPYASIRFSFHENTIMSDLIFKVHVLNQKGYSAGIWGLNHPNMQKRNATVRRQCKELGIDYREKEYLDDTHGTYKYPDAITGIKNIEVKCYPSELLIAPDGLVYPCHHLLYSKNPCGMSFNEFFEGGYEFSTSVFCTEYGLCNPCDVKIKTNRLQQGGHTSVEIIKKEG